MKRIWLSPKGHLNILEFTHGFKHNFTPKCDSREWSATSHVYVKQCFLDSQLVALVACGIPWFAVNFAQAGCYANVPLCHFPSHTHHRCPVLRGMHNLSKCLHCVGAKEAHGRWDICRWASRQKNRLKICSLHTRDFVAASFRYLLADSLFPLFPGGMVWGRRPQAHTHFARAEGAEASVRQAAAIAPDDDWRGRTRDSKATKCKAQSPAEARAPAAPAAQMRRGEEEEGRKGGG